MNLKNLGMFQSFHVFIENNKTSMGYILLFWLGYIIKTLIQLMSCRNELWKQTQEDLIMEFCCLRPWTTNVRKPCHLQGRGNKMSIPDLNEITSRSCELLQWVQREIVRVSLTPSIRWKLPESWVQTQIKTLIQSEFRKRFKTFWTTNTSWLARNLLKTPFELLQWSQYVWYLPDETPPVLQPHILSSSPVSM